MLQWSFCTHRNTTRPFGNAATGKAYYRCLDCGKEIIAPLWCNPPMGRMWPRNPILKALKRAWEFVWEA